MTQPGIGAMIGMLSGNEDTVRAYQSVLGRKIIEARIDPDLHDEAVVLRFSDGASATIWDDGRSCCESRYITTDDNLSDLVGKRLHSVEIKDGPEETGDYDSHETAFVEIAVRDGTRVTLTTHNVHNGYYGGFYFRMTAQGIEAATAGEPEGLDGNRESPVTEGHAPQSTGIRAIGGETEG